jgi:hypothetical protein
VNKPWLRRAKDVSFFWGLSGIGYLLLRYTDWVAHEVEIEVPRGAPLVSRYLLHNHAALHGHVVSHARGGINERTTSLHVLAVAFW